MKKGVREKQNKIKPSPEFHRIHIDSGGVRAGHSGPAIAWVDLTTGDEFVEAATGFTDYQNKYRALLSAMRNLPVGSEAKICSHSVLLLWRYNHSPLEADDHNVANLTVEIWAESRERNVSFQLLWIPRRKNRATKLLARWRRSRIRVSRKSAETVRT